MLTNAYGRFKACCLFLLLILLPVLLKAQSASALALEQQVYRYNNQLKFDSSKALITAFFTTPALSAENKFYGFLYLSYTHKRLYDYPSTLQYLDSAGYYGSKTSNPLYFLNNVACQKAFAFFDTHEYEKADSIMQQLHQNDYRFLNEENQSKIAMQEAYLHYLRKQYKEAEERYQEALVKMQQASPCDQPMIYGKLVELFGAVQKYNLMQQAYKKAVASADSCGILKYKLYANEMMIKALEQSGEYKLAIFYTHLLDSLNQVYNSQTHRNKLLELEEKHRSTLLEQQMTLQQKTIQSKNLLITLLFLGLLLIGSAITLYLYRLRQLKLKQEKDNTERYTSQLLQKTEEDRKRIAGHLHDSVNHELLTIKNTLLPQEEDLRSRIDMLIDDVRHISHNLHPIVFSRVGLAHSIQQLAERVQEKNHFMLLADVQYEPCLQPEAELQLFRIIQEAVSNMIKYSRAIAGKITINQLPKAVLVEIKDNGQGFDVKEALNSDRAFGLHNIMERSKAAGGKATITSGRKGTIITIKIPCSNP